MIRRVPLLGAMAVLAAAGCGGDDQPTKEGFVAEAKAICAAADKQRDAIRGDAHTLLSTEKFDDPALLTRYNAVARDAIAKLKALEAPEEERAGLQKVLAAAEKAAVALDDRIAALKAKDRDAQDRAAGNFEAAYGDVSAAVGATDLAGCETLGN